VADITDAWAMRASVSARNAGSGASSPASAAWNTDANTMVPAV
jgi:hypothetical protein